jgi:hypothetical protein
MLRLRFMTVIVYQLGESGEWWGGGWRVKKLSAESVD